MNLRRVVSQQICLILANGENAMKSKWIGSGLSVVILLCLATSAASAQQYVMTLLGFAPYSYTINGVNGLNNSGDVVGYDSVIDGAYLYHGDVISSLGMTSGVGVAINNSGHIAVRSWGPDLHSYLYTPGRLPRFVSHFTDIGTLGGSGGLNNTGQTIAMDMNDSRTIVGASTVVARILVVKRPNDGLGSAPVVRDEHRECN
jgi:hypothetical protein